MEFPDFPFSRNYVRRLLDVTSYDYVTVRRRTVVFLIFLRDSVTPWCAFGFACTPVAYRHTPVA